MFAFGVLLFVINVLRSRWTGAIAGNNPWDAATLEWSVSSPPPAYNFEIIPTVATRDPLWDAHDETALPSSAQILDEHKETIGTSLEDAAPIRRLLMPEETIVPLLVAVALTVIFGGLIIQSTPVIVAGAIAAVVFVAEWMWPGDEFPEAPI